MSLTDIAFLAGPLGALVIAPVAVVVLVVRRPPRWILWLGVALVLIVAASWLGYWFLWQRAFGYADAYEPVPAAVDAGEGVTMAVAAVGSVGLAMTTVTALVFPTRSALGAEGA